ncbi:ankyrin repeat protein [Colletotrichum tofieldiae]|uniref:Ankyrin repeat protein n=1 Tax=Colletotrichum tofieldiae TaxID=708197 RepID=A0A161WKC3_9PEZI|nr:ankyrin repeat protein [Colletotrichum tofieldiae]
MDLHLAARRGNHNIVKRFLEEDDIDINLEDIIGQTPLHLASENGHDNVTELLLKQDEIDLNPQDKDRRTPLHLAAKNGHKDVANLLLEMDEVGLNSQDKNGQTPLLWAAKNRHDKVVKLMLKKDKIDLNIQDNNGRTPLSWATENKHMSMIRLLLNAAIDRKSKAYSSHTLLSWAAEHGYERVVKLLLEDVVDPNVHDNNSRTPLLLAIENEHEGVVELLVQNDSTTLHLLAREGEIAPINSIISTNYDINTKNDLGRTALHISTSYHHLEVAKLLISSGADVNAKDINGATPLHLAIASRHHDFIELLLKNAAYPKGITVNKTQIFCQEQIDDSDARISVAVWAPSEDVLEDRICLDFSDWAEYGIAWTMTAPKKHNNSSRWKTRDHFSMLPNGWIPDDGIDFFYQFIAELTIRWSKLCNSAEGHLSMRRIDQLGKKGESHDFIHRLAEDAKCLAELRSFHRGQVRSARNFAVHYSRRYCGGDDPKAMQELDNFSNVVGENLHFTVRIFARADF